MEVESVVVDVGQILNSNISQESENNHKPITNKNNKKIKNKSITMMIIGFLQTLLIFIGGLCLTFKPDLFQNEDNCQQLICSYVQISNQSPLHLNNLTRLISSCNK